jgi:ubiquinone/menaquinone biosynthesis C-methylase UbiE
LAILDDVLIKSGRKELAVDIGAGTGQASIPLTKIFSKVRAFDPSPGQIEQTKEIKIGKLRNVSLV